MARLGDAMLYGHGRPPAWPGRVPHHTMPYGMPPHGIGKHLSVCVCWLGGTMGSESNARVIVCCALDM